jgi:hypothetical protein
VRAIKLLVHGMKVVERVLENRISEMQFGFTPGKATTDTIFIVRQMQDKFRTKKEEAVYCALYI